MFTQQLIVLISGLDVRYVTLSFLDRSIYYITRQGRASGPLRGKGLRKSLDNQWLICELIILTPSCICLHASRPEINSIDSV